MRTTLTTLGALAIATYAVLGALLMSNWSVVAASGHSLATTIADMREANQPYSVVPGFLFAGIGILLAIAWAVMRSRANLAMPGWVSFMLWAGIVAFGAPAYFFASFGNLNSVGDTYDEWNAAAASLLEAPLYVASGLAMLCGVIASIAGAIKSANPRRLLQSRGQTSEPVEQL